MKHIPSIEGVRQVKIQWNVLRINKEVERWCHPVALHGICHETLTTPAPSLGCGTFTL